MVMGTDVLCRFMISKNRIIIIDGDGLAILQLLWLKQNQKTKRSALSEHSESSLEASKALSRQDVLSSNVQLEISGFSGMHC